MQISVSGQNIDIGSALKEYVTERLDRSVKKYFDRAIFGNVVFQGPI